MKKTIHREYKGKPAKAQKLAEKDARKLAKKGYTVTGQIYTEGRWTGKDFFVALLLCFLIVGIFAFIYMLLVKPAGTLTVTYTKA